MPKVKITSQGTRYVDIKELRESSAVKETLEFAARRFGRLPGPHEGREVTAVEGAEAIGVQAPPVRERRE